MDTLTNPPVNHLNPIQRKIASGMNPILAFLSEATCGESCWEAREDICHCSCNGKNHGCMRSANGTRPQRTAKIDGVRYVLKAVGTGLYAEAKAINNAAGYKSVDRISDTLTYHYAWKETDRGAPARLKTATRKQIESWPELTATRERFKELQLHHACGIDYRNIWPDLLWVKL